MQKGRGQSTAFALRGEVVAGSFTRESEQTWVYRACKKKEREKGGGKKGEEGR